MLSPQIQEARGARVCERKFVALAEAWGGALEVLSLHCRPEVPHHLGTVESIYFDDRWFSSYWEKIDGDNYKRKVRVRWYVDAGENLPPGGQIQAFLDIKDRIGAAREKRHIAFRADRELLCAGPLHEPDLQVLLARALREGGVPVAAGLVPTLSIRYVRRRYVCPWTGAKINLDSQICSPRANTELFSGAMPLESGRVVCEAKSAASREWSWAESLQRLGFRSQSFSKYGLFMEMRMQGSM